jgi:hypothetical protein
MAEGSAEKHTVGCPYVYEVEDARGILEVGWTFSTQLLVSYGAPQKECIT